MTAEPRIGCLAEPTVPFPELRAGNLGVRVAATAAEIDAVQALRYRVFYRELGATADAETARTGRDRDRFDQIADHLLVGGSWNSAVPAWMRRIAIAPRCSCCGAASPPTFSTTRST